MTKRERLENKMAKRLEWAESRRNKAASSYTKADLREEVSGIPLGQPILLGHHSEGKHRRAIEQADNAMRAAYENQKMSDYHEAKAEGLESMLNSTIFSDDVDAVEQIEKRIADLEAEKELKKAINKIIRIAPVNLLTEDKMAKLLALGLSLETAKKVFDKDCMGCIGFPSYELTNLGAKIRANKQRLVYLKIQQSNRQEASASPEGITIKINRHGDYFVTFAEKPERDILNALREAGYTWRQGSWIGTKGTLPECLKKHLS